MRRLFLRGSRRAARDCLPEKLGTGFFGGEGLFFATLPFSRLVSRVFAATPQGGGRGRDEGGFGSLVGGLLGGLLGGDNDD